MSIRILSGELLNEDGKTGACLYCSTSGRVFGPLFGDRWDAQEFLDWCLAEYGRVPCEIINDAYAAFLFDRGLAEFECRTEVVDAGR